MNTELQESRKRLTNWWAVKQYDAFILPGRKGLHGVSEAPKDRYVAYETTNFGVLLSPVQPNGFRKIVVRE